MISKKWLEKFLVVGGILAFVVDTITLGQIVSSIHWPGITILPMSITSQTSTPTASIAGSATIAASDLTLFLLVFSYFSAFAWTVVYASHMYDGDLGDFTNRFVIALAFVLQSLTLITFLWVAAFGPFEISNFVMFHCIVSWLVVLGLTSVAAYILATEKLGRVPHYAALVLFLLIPVWVFGERMIWNTTWLRSFGSLLLFGIGGTALYMALVGGAVMLLYAVGERVARFLFF